MIDCYVLKFWNIDGDNKIEWYAAINVDNFVYIETIKEKEFIECIHIPSLKQISYTELTNLYASFKKQALINHLNRQKQKIENELKAIEDKIQAEKNKE